MDLEEVLRRKFYREQLEESAEAAHSRLPISCDDMSNSEKNSFIQFLVAESYKKDQQIDRLQQTIDAQGERQSVMQLTLDKIESAQHATRDENIKLNAQLVLQSKNLKKLQSDSTTNSKALNKALREAAKYRGLYEVLRDEKFVGTSQKSGKSRPEAGRDDDKDDWTGAGNTVNDESSSETDKECAGPTCSDSTNIDSVEEHKKEERPYRQGLKYNTMKAEATILHKCDLTRIPAGATIIKTEIRSSFHFISRIEEHQQEYVTYRTKDGRLVTCFYPMKKPAQGSVSETLSEDVHTDNAGAYDEEEQILKNFPGTHATVDMLVKLVFNAYMLETPVYRDMIRLFELKFNVSRQTILNWLSKGSTALKKLLPVLKAQALVKDSIINCDETWCRVKMQDKYKKAYIWCLVNKSAGIVIFFYDEGSRGRKVLTDFLEEAELAALQSDAYNVYKYLDGHLPSDEIKRRRNGSETTEIVGSIWMELTRLLDDPLPKGDLLTKALHYLKNAWTPVMAYRNDGLYSIDNSIAERSIRSLTIERKNKMAFGSHQGAETSTVYHTFMETCKMGALSFYKFLKNYLTAFMEGRTDFENLTPAILGKIN